MTYRGHIEQGKIVLDEPADLEEGASVVIELIYDSSNPISEAGAKRLELYRDVIGAISGMPSDWAENHDHYLRQQPHS